MALTRQQVEVVMFRRLAPALTRAGMSSDTQGINADMADPISFALAELGYNLPSDITNPGDSDLAQVISSDVSLYLSVVEVRLVQNIIGNLDDTDERLGPMGQWGSQFAKQMERHLESLLRRLENDYGFGLGRLSGDVYQVVSAEQEA